MLTRWKFKIKRWLRPLNVWETHRRLIVAEQELLEWRRLYSDLVSMGVDVHFKEDHMILIYTRLGGGQIREIRAHFRDMRDVERLVRELKERYRIKQPVFVDFPRGLDFTRELLRDI